MKKKRFDFKIEIKKTREKVRKIFNEVRGYPDYKDLTILDKEL